MSLTISLVEAPPPETAPRRAALTRAVAAALVSAIAAGPHADRSLIFLDDAQVGYVASDASPAAIEAALASLDEPLAGEARAAVAAILAFAQADGWDLTIQTNDDRSWMPGNTPEIRLSLARSDAPDLSWSASHVQRAFGDLGFPMGRDDHSIRVPARALAEACRGRIDHDALRLAEVASYALRRGGPQAEVVAA